MRILHTSDWHLGHKLYDRSRVEEHQQFLTWLHETLLREQIDILLVAGDVFDTALPSAVATDLYYRFLHRVYSETDVFTLITAGNHDSGVRLAASREFLRLGRAHVIGKMPEDVEDCVVNIDAVSVAMVPYLPEGEILSYVSFEEQVEAVQRYREAVRQIYQACVDAMLGDTYRILMGHLFLHGGTASQSERPIQIGGSLPVAASDVPDGIDYVALGHLHRPQTISHPSSIIRYSGSALPMTFREAEYAKQVILLDTEAKTTTELEIPEFCKLTRINGTYDEVLQQAATGDWEGQLLEVHLRLTEAGITAADTVRSVFADRGGDVLVVETLRETAQDDTKLSAEEMTTRSPEEIFEAYYRYNFPAGTRLPQLSQVFSELVERSQHQRKEEVT